MNSGVLGTGTVAITVSGQAQACRLGLPTPAHQPETRHRSPRGECQDTGGVPSRAASDRSLASGHSGAPVGIWQWVSSLRIIPIVNNSPPGGLAGL